MAKITWPCVGESDNVKEILIWGVESDCNKQEWWVVAESNNEVWNKSGCEGEMGRKEKVTIKKNQDACLTPKSKGTRVWGKNICYFRRSSTLRGELDFK